MLTLRARLLLAGVLTTSFLAIGCGRNQTRQASLLPRIDVSKLVNAGLPESEQLSEEDAEQLANNRIDAERRAEPAEAEMLLASASEKSNWRDLIPKSRKARDSEFGEDPFLDGLDDLMSETAAATPAATETAAPAASDFEAFADAAEPVADAGNLSRSGAMDFAPLDKIDAATSAAATADPFADIDRAAEDLFAEVNPAVAAEETKKAPLLRARPRRETLASSSDDVQGFDDLFNHEANPVGSEEVFDPTDDLPVVAETADSNEPLFSASRYSEPVDESITRDPTSELVDPELFETVDIEEPVASGADIPVSTVGLTETQQPTVSANKPAILAADPFAESAPEPPEEPAVAEVAQSPERDFAASFPEMEPFAELDDPPVAEPEPRFVGTPTEAPQAAAAPGQLPVEAVSRGAILPEVNWEGRTETAAETTRRAPGEWTAWFLLTGGVLIFLLLFAPGRRT